MTKDEKAPEESQEAVKSVENLQEESQKEISDIANEVAALANRLVHKTEFNRLIGGMLASRRLYQMCLYELDLLCDETDFKKASRIEGEENLDVQKTLPPERLAFLKEVLINSAAIEAQKPFNENDLFQQMATTVFPWMQEIVVKHNEQERKEQRKGFEEAYLIVQGKGILQWEQDGEINEKRVETGDLIYFPENVFKHQLLNNHETPMTVVYATSPPVR